MSNTIYFSLLRSWNRSIQCPFRSAMAARPGPVVQTDRNVAKLIAKARRGPFRKLFDYNGERRFVEPYGVLIGPRNYLVARQPSKGAELRHLRLDRIRDASVTEEWFCKDPDFSLARYASRSFGSFQDENEFGEVIWRFSADAADRASEWRFHPSQSFTMLPDGRLEVRFEASGLQEMAWHLHCWGDAVEVVAPTGLKRLVEGDGSRIAVLH